MNISLFLLFFASIIEPFIWLMAFDRCFKRKYTRKMIYFSYIIGDWLIAIIRNNVIELYPAISVIFTVVSIVYVVGFVRMMYEGTMNKRLLLIGLLFIASLCSDFIIIGMLMLLGNTVSDIAGNGILNSIATLISKCIFFMLSLLITKRSRHQYEDADEIVPIMFGTILCELPCVILYNQVNLLDNNGYMLIIFVFGQIVLLALIAYVIIILNRRKKMERQLRTRLHDIEIEVESLQSWEENMIEVRHFRHDIKMHLSVLKGLIQESKYDKAEQYLSEIAEEVNQVEDFSTLKNRNVAIVLSQKKRLADKQRVLFLPEIMVEDYIISDKDVCSILCNVLDNAIEAASKCVNGFINIVIRPDAETSGYFIICENNYELVNLYRGKYITTKDDKEKHGLGIDIIKRLVKGYCGKCSFTNDSNTKNFVVEIYIPGV